MSFEFGQIPNPTFDLADAAGRHAQRVADLLLGFAERDAHFPQPGPAFDGGFASGFAVADRDERPVGLAGDVALETPHDLEFALSLLGFPYHVVLGGLVVAHAHQGDVIQGPVALTVTGSVQPVPVGLAAGCRQRAGAAELGEHRLGADSFRVVAADDGQLGRRHGAHAVHVEQGTRVLFQNLAHAALQHIGPVVQFAP